VLWGGGKTVPRVSVGNLLTKGGRKEEGGKNRGKGAPVRERGQEESNFQKRWTRERSGVHWMTLPLAMSAPRVSAGGGGVEMKGRRGGGSCAGLRQKLCTLFHVKENRCEEEEGGRRREGGRLKGPELHRNRNGLLVSVILQKRRGKRGEVGQNVKKAVAFSPFFSPFHGKGGGGDQKRRRRMLTRYVECALDRLIPSKEGGGKSNRQCGCLIFSLGEGGEGGFIPQV